MTKIQYDRSKKLAGLGQTIWQRIGPQHWFDMYSIVTQNNPPSDVDLGGLPVYVLPDTYEKSGHSREALHAVVSSEWFHGLVGSDLQGYDFLSYRPVQDEDRIDGVRVIATDISFSRRYENKVAFRTEFSHEVPMAAYQIIASGELDVETVGSYLDQWGAVVLQDEFLSSGVGTYVIKNAAAIGPAVAQLQESGRQVVASQWIDGYDISVQCCATKFGTFVGPLQKQLINEPGLSNPDVLGVEKYNGLVVLDNNDMGSIATEARAIARKLGDTMYKQGFRGIFSVDMYVESSTENVYVIEVNPRMTGATPLYNMMQADAAVPLPLLHILEVAGYDYEIPEITDTDLAVQIPRSAMLMVRSMHTDTKKVMRHFSSGTYDSDGSFVSGDLRMQGKPVVYSYATEGDEIKPGDKLAAVFIPQINAIDNGQIIAHVSEIVQSIHATLEE